MKPRAIDLFCGCGGLTLGLTSAGFNVIGALDNWPIAIQTYRRNFSHPVVCEPIEKLSASEFLGRICSSNTQIDLVAGGPPCQGFSIQRIGKDTDDRNALVLEFARFVQELHPRMFLMENVPGLLGKRGRLLAARLGCTLKSAGYEIRVKQVNAAEYGIPQIRKRIFFYGWKSHQGANFVFPPSTCSRDQFRTVAEAIGDLPQPSHSRNQSVQSDPLHFRTNLSELNLERLRHIPPGGGFEDLPVELRVNCHKNGASKIGHRYVYGRLAPDRPAGTITARFDSFTRGKFAHPLEDRNITLREGARLQTFPDTFRFSGTQEEIAAQVGNAIPPLLATTIARAMSSYLTHDSERLEPFSKTEPEDQFALFGADREP
jgi:DNA (cytosine-5)-methyltransferase 1